MIEPIQTLRNKSKFRDIQVAGHTNAVALQARGACAPGRPCQEIAEIRQHLPGCIAITGQAVLLFQHPLWYQ